MHLLAIVIGFLLDLLIGDPRRLYHPVRLIGKLIEALEKPLRGVFARTDKGERAAGRVLVVLVCGITTAVAFLILFVLYRMNFWIGFVVETIMCYQLFAVRSLRDESMKVYRELEKDDLEGARYAVSMIVGRDTKSLDAEGVTKATVETIAENTADGTLAPLFYMMIGGPVLGWFYKSVNTMDSMVGYKNEKYIHFGRCGAKFDDVLNFIPARLCAVFMIIASGFMGLDAKNAARIFKRDRFNHASPNSAQTEAVMAGALNVQLAGNAYYFGKLYEKPTIGDANRPIAYKDIKRANQLLYMTAIVAIIFLGAIRVMAGVLVNLLYIMI